MTNKIKILWADDDHYELYGIAERLMMEGFEVTTVGTLREAKEAIAKSPPDIAILDIMMPPGEENSSYETKGGFASGIVLAKWIKQNYPQVSFIGFSVIHDPEIIDFFVKYGAGYLTKPERPSAIIEYIKKVAGQSGKTINLRSFIVHGHDNAAKLELKNYLQNVLIMPEPIILHEQPSLGRTILEKFEDQANDVDIIFVLLTPDDLIANLTDSNKEKRRARQNVIFEMGYFLGKFSRQSARVFLLHKGAIELPSDISGLIYIDISNGMQSAGEDIRRELSKWL